MSRYLGTMTREQRDKLIPQEEDTVLLTDDPVMYSYYSNGSWLESEEPVAAVKGMSMGVSLYELNKQLVEQNGPLTNAQEKIGLINSYRDETGAGFYLLYGKEISYFTLFTSIFQEYEFETLGEAVFECLENVGEVYSVERTEDQAAIEIWVKSEEEITCMYLFPYDTGIVRIAL